MLGILRPYTTLSNLSGVSGDAHDAHDAHDAYSREDTSAISLYSQ